MDKMSIACYKGSACRLKLVTRKNDDGNDKPLYVPS